MFLTVTVGEIVSDPSVTSVDDVIVVPFSSASPVSAAHSVGRAADKTADAVLDPWAGSPDCADNPACAAHPASAHSEAATDPKTSFRVMTSPPGGPIMDRPRGS
jgi:hypothetical protein